MVEGQEVQLACGGWADSPIPLLAAWGYLQSYRSSALIIRSVLTIVHTAVHTFHIFRKSMVSFKLYSTTNQGNTFGQHKSYRSSVKLGSLEPLSGARKHRPKQKHVNKLTSTFVNLTALNKLTISSLIVQYVRPSTLVTEASIGSCKYCAVTQLVISA